MNPSLWVVAVLCCARLSPGPAGGGPPGAVGGPPPDAAASKVDAVTVYQGQALVTREVAVPEGPGTVELVVTPLPPQTVEGSLFAEGAEGLRVLSTRLRTRSVLGDTRAEVRALEERIKTLQDDALGLQKQLAVRGQDLQYLQKLEGFTGVALNGLTARGRLDSEAVVALSRFVMETRGERSQAETDLNAALRANTEAQAFARGQLAEVSAGASRTVFDAVVVVHKTRPEAGTVRLGYLVYSATWAPQYRLRGAGDGKPVRLEYLAAVSQQTGEAWPAARLTLSTARPTLDASPPELLPLKMMAVAPAAPETLAPGAAGDEASRAVLAELGKPVDLPFPNETPLGDVVKYVRSITKGPRFPEGVPVYVDPVGLQDAEKTMNSPVTIDVAAVPLRTSLRMALKQLGLAYQVKDGLLTITSASDLPGVGDGESGPGVRLSVGLPGGFGVSPLDQAAAGGQAEELRVADGAAAPEPPAPERETPSVAFPIEGRLDVPSRRDPQLLEIARVDLGAEFYAKAVPVLSQRVYRLAKLTNKADLVLLPGEATVYEGGSFVGRMRLPLVAAGEPFIAGFGIDPQLQVARRLLRKSRTVQGGNQIFNYEFRIGLRNYHGRPVRVELWDRLPRPEGESVAVNLVKTSEALSADPLYQRTARLDNLLLWDLKVPEGTVGEKTLYLNYEFRLEFARDLPQPRFDSGGLREGPIGGGAIGGMGGGMGGMGSGGFR